tara:strand:+ start:350 stop:574 length:225 start_codon:yes stop_codon:yes gene_type:complete
MKKIAIHVRVDPRIKDDIDLMSIKHNRSQSDVARILIEYSLEKYRKFKEGNRTGLEILHILGLSETSTNGSENR